MKHSFTQTQLYFFLLLSALFIWTKPLSNITEFLLSVLCLVTCISSRVVLIWSMKAKWSLLAVIAAQEECTSSSQTNRRSFPRIEKRCQKQNRSFQWGLSTLRHGIQLSMEAILACHPARSTEWPDCHPKSCELWRIRTGPIQFVPGRVSLTTRRPSFQTDRLDFFVLWPMLTWHQLQFLVTSQKCQGTILLTCVAKHTTKSAVVKTEGTQMSVSILRDEFCRHRHAAPWSFWIMVRSWWKLCMVTLLVGSYSPAFSLFFFFGDMSSVQNAFAWDSNDLLSFSRPFLKWRHFGRFFRKAHQILQRAWVGMKQNQIKQKSCHLAETVK